MRYLLRMTTSIVETRTAGERYDDEVAEHLRSYLAARRMTKRDLARALGVTDFWVGRRLNGQTAVSVGELLTIAHALEEPVERFLPGQGSMLAAGNLRTAGARSSTDRASDYGSGAAHFW